MRKIFAALKRIYFRWFANQARPIMVYYNRNFQNERKEHIRISTSTHLDQRQKLNLDSQVYIGHFCRLEASNRIDIGEGVQLASYCNIVTHSSHNSIRVYGNEYTKQSNLKGYIKGPVSIGKYTFVGPFSLILPNTKIGKGCLVHAYSLVRGEFPDFSIIAGNPAKVIGSTKEKDAKILKENPELKPFYKAWANE